MPSAAFLLTYRWAQAYIRKFMRKFFKGFRKQHPDIWSGLHYLPNDCWHTRLAKTKVIVGMIVRPWFTWLSQWKTEFHGQILEKDVATPQSCILFDVSMSTCLDKTLTINCFLYTFLSSSYYNLKKKSNFSNTVYFTLVLLCSVITEQYQITVNA